MAGNISVRDVAAPSLHQRIFTTGAPQGGRRLGRVGDLVASIRSSLHLRRSIRVLHYHRIHATLHVTPRRLSCVPFSVERCSSSAFLHLQVTALP